MSPFYLFWSGLRVATSSEKAPGYTTQLAKARRPRWRRWERKRDQIPSGADLN